MHEFMRKEWNLDKILFVSGPPDPQVLRRVFTGRDAELSVACSSLLDAPFRLLLNGLFGVGKTVFIKELRRRTASENTEAPLFIEEKMYTGDSSIEYTILRGLVSELTSESAYASDLDRQYLGQSTHRLSGNGAETEVEVGPRFLKGKRKKLQSHELQINQMKIPDPIPVIRRLIGEAQAKYPNRRIIISIDDLDRERDPDEVRSLLLGCRALLQDSMCSFILTSHPIGVTRDAYSSAGGIVDKQSDLPTFDRDTMVLMAARYLGAGRVKKWTSRGEPSFDGDKPAEGDLLPFTYESMNAIVERSYGIPRILSTVCVNILWEARKFRMQTIGLGELKKCWDACRSSLTANVSPDLRSLLDVFANRIDKIDIEDIPDHVFDELHADTRDELIKQLDFAIKNDLLITNEDGHAYVLNSMLDPFEKGPVLTAQTSRAK